jgi:hypothetical protein
MEHGGVAAENRIVNVVNRHVPDICRRLADEPVQLHDQFALQQLQPARLRAEFNAGQHVLSVPRLRIQARRHGKLASVAQVYQRRDQRGRANVHRHAKQ